MKDRQATKGFRGMTAGTAATVMKALPVYRARPAKWAHKVNAANAVKKARAVMTAMMAATVTMAVTVMMVWKDRWGLRAVMAFKASGRLARKDPLGRWARKATSARRVVVIRDP